MKVYLNGSIQQSKTAGDILESGLLFGWGVFETLRIYQGKPAFLQDHIKRLKKSCQKIFLQLPKVDFGNKIKALLKANRLSDAYCRITIFKKRLRTGVLITVTPFFQYNKDNYKKGFKAMVVPFVKSSKNLLTDIKSTSYLENMIARKIAENRGNQEAIFLNESGFLAEGSRSNLFFIKGESAYTPSLECGILNGITRQKVIEIIKSQKLRLRIGKFKLGELLSCDEAFLTSSLMEIMPLVEVNKKPIQNREPGMITYSIHKTYRDLVERDR